MQLRVDREYFEAVENKEFLRKLIEILLRQENRLRILEGKPEVTKGQFIQAVKQI